VQLFLPDAAGRRPIYGDRAKFHHDPHWRDLALVYEYNRASVSGRSIRRGGRRSSQTCCGPPAGMDAGSPGPACRTVPARFRRAPPG
jgi:hypothetical protein